MTSGFSSKLVSEVGTSFGYGLVAEMLSLLQLMFLLSVSQGLSDM